jgi:uncharacterized protein YlxW (UPF0749 family)
VRPSGDAPEGERERRRWRVAMPLAALVAGLLFAASATTSHGIDLRVNAHDDGVTFASREQQTVESDTKTLAKLQKEVQAATSQAARTDSRVAQLRDEADAIAQAAGLEQVHGPAITVSLDDAPPLPGAQKGSVPPDYLVVHQQDVQAVVNALWAGGAEAMTLQGQRVISTSAVRCVGNTLLLHGLVYSPPYVVTAIGDVEGMQQSLQTSPDIIIYKQYVVAYKLGYAVTTHDDITLPGYTGALSLPQASALPGTATASAPAPRGRTPSAPVGSPTAAGSAGAVGSAAAAGS